MHAYTDVIQKSKGRGQLLAAPFGSVTGAVDALQVPQYVDSWCVSAIESESASIREAVVHHGKEKRSNALSSSCDAFAMGADDVRRPMTGLAHVQCRRVHRDNLRIQPVGTSQLM